MQQRGESEGGGGGEAEWRSQDDGDAQDEHETGEEERFGKAGECGSQIEGTGWDNAWYRIRRPDLQLDESRRDRYCLLLRIAVIRRCNFEAGGIPDVSTNAQAKNRQFAGATGT